MAAAASGAGKADLLHFTVSKLPEVSVDVPQQENCVDCGLYMLKCMELMLKVPRTLDLAQIRAAVRGDALMPNSALPLGFFRRDWFVKECALLQRTRFIVLILKTIRDAQPLPVDNMQVTALKNLDNEIDRRLTLESIREQAVKDAQ